MDLGREIISVAEGYRAMDERRAIETQLTYEASGGADFQSGVEGAEIGLDLRA